VILLARDALVRKNRRRMFMMFVRLSVCLERACIVIILCTLARIKIYGWIVQLFWGDTLTPKHVHLLPAVFFQFHLEERRGMDVQTRRDISRTVEDSG